MTPKVMAAALEPALRRLLQLLMVGQEPGQVVAGMCRCMLRHLHASAVLSNDAATLESAPLFSCQYMFADCEDEINAHAT